LPLGWLSSETAGTPAPQATPALGGTRAANDREFRVLPGWPFWGTGAEERCALWLKTIGFHLGGWLLTIVAASLGAPFWFDLLNKFINIRSTGKAPEEDPKKPKEVPLPLAPGKQTVES
jgi:hypothetical protein